MEKSEYITGEYFIMRILMERDTDYPRFTSDRLYHIIKNICINYTGNFYISEVDGGQACMDGQFAEVTQMSLMVSGVTEAEADMVAADICAFLGLNSVWVEKKNVCGYRITESLGV